MPLVIALLALLAIIIVGIWLTSHLIGLVITLIIAGIVGWIANQILPGKIPYGWLGAVVAGLLGSWLGTLVLGSLGPTIGGITIIPAIIGAVVLGFGANAIAKANGRGRLGSGGRYHRLD